MVDKSYEVPLPGNTDVFSFILSDHLVFLSFHSK